MPSLGATPYALLGRCLHVVLQLHPLAPNEEDGPYWRIKSLKDGDVVGFCWTEDRGWRTMTINADRTWSLDSPFPDDTNCFCDSTGLLDVEGELSGVAEALADDARELPKSFDVKGWTWSDELTFRVRALESGAAHFEPVGV